MDPRRYFDFFEPVRKECRERPYYTRARFKISNTRFWIPLLPVGDGRGWVKVSNGLVKGLLSFLAMYLNNVICGLEFELIVLKEKAL